MNLLHTFNVIISSIYKVMFLVYQNLHRFAVRRQPLPSVLLLITKMTRSAIHQTIVARVSNTTMISGAIDTAPIVQIHVIQYTAVCIRE